MELVELPRIQGPVNTTAARTDKPFRRQSYNLVFKFDALRAHKYDPLCVLF